MPSYRTTILSALTQYLHCRICLLTRDTTVSLGTTANWFLVGTPVTASSNSTRIWATLPSSYERAIHSGAALHSVSGTAVPISLPVSIRYIHPRHCVVSMVTAYVMVTRQQDRPNHCRIKSRNENGQVKYFLVENLTFDSLYELVEHYKRNRLRSANFELSLREPVPKVQLPYGKEWVVFHSPPCASGEAVSLILMSSRPAGIMTTLTEGRLRTCSLRSLRTAHSSSDAVCSLTEAGTTLYHSGTQTPLHHCLLSPWQSQHLVSIFGLQSREQVEALPHHVGQDELRVHDWVGYVWLSVRISAVLPKTSSLPQDEVALRSEPDPGGEVWAGMCSTSPSRGYVSYNERYPCHDRSLCSCLDRWGKVYSLIACSTPILATFPCDTNHCYLVLNHLPNASQSVSLLSYLYIPVCLTALLSIYLSLSHCPPVCIYQSVSLSSSLDISVCLTAPSIYISVRLTALLSLHA